MGEFQVTQRTKDGMFNATTLLKQWNETKGMKKDVKDFLVNKNTKEFISELISQNYNRGNSPYLSTRGKNGGTWMHPYLFIKFAMWINPKFELQVIKFVHDELIKYRHEAGDNYLILGQSLQKLDKQNYKEVATAINYIVFNKKSKDLRQTATAEQLTELTDVEKKISFLIDMEQVTKHDQLMRVLRRMYALKYVTPF
jgi:hypothetical protein